MGPDRGWFDAGLVARWIAAFFVALFDAKLAIWSLPWDERWPRVSENKLKTHSAPLRHMATIRYCDTGMRFTWDPAKARKNQQLHGVSFTTAAEVFDDPNHVVGDNYYMEESGEQRFQMIGMTRGLVLLLVVFIEPGSDAIRKAVDYEESIYNDQFR
jgi:uncharacterized protein